MGACSGWLAHVPLAFPRLVSRMYPIVSLRIPHALPVVALRHGRLGHLLAVYRTFLMARSVCLRAADACVIALAGPFGLSPLGIPHASLRIRSTCQESFNQSFKLKNEEGQSFGMVVITQASKHWYASVPDLGLTSANAGAKSRNKVDDHLREEWRSGDVFGVQ